MTPHTNVSPKSRSEFTALQRRLKYVERFPTKSWTILTENVPEWPVNPLTNFEDYTDAGMSYAPCNGYTDLLEAICKRERVSNDLELAAEHLLVTNGALHGLALIFRELYEPSAVALCQTPVLGSINATLLRCGYDVKYFSMEDYGVNVEELRSLCTPDVRLIYINSPSNPEGKVCLEPSFRQLVDLAEERNIALVTDAVYDSFVFDHRNQISPLNCTNDWRNLYVANSLSKNFGAAGLRIGWIASDPENIRALAGTLEQENIAVCGSAQQQAQYLLSMGNQSLVDTVLEGRRFLEDALSKLDSVRFESPVGGTQIFVELPVTDVEDFADYMMDFGLVLTTSSNYFGAKGSQVRVPLGQPLKKLSLALKLLREGLSDWSSHGETSRARSFTRGGI